MNPFVIACDGLGALLFAYWFGKRMLGTKPTVRSAPLREALRFRLPWVLGFALVFLPLSVGWLGLRILPFNGWLQVVGVGLCLVGLAFLWCSYEVKTRVEERFMTDPIGEAYTRYAAKVKRLIPFVV